MFSTLEPSLGYWKIEIDERHHEKTAFTLHHGLYRFTRMPFGPKNDPATFQKAIDIRLVSVCWQFTLAYLDDLVLYSMSPQDHTEPVRRVLKLLYKAGATLKLMSLQAFRRDHRPSGSLYLYWTC